MTTCVIDGRACQCQPDEGMFCVRANNMRAALEAAEKALETISLHLSDPAFGGREAAFSRHDLEAIADAALAAIRKWP